MSGEKISVDSDKVTINDYEITDEDMKQVYDKYSGKGEKVDFVSLGCPSHDVFWLKRVAEMLKGRKIKEGVTLWIQATPFSREAAKERCFDKWITDAGGKIICVMTRWSKKDL